MAFTYYDELPIEEPQTIPELVASLDSQEKGAILNGFSRRFKSEVVAARIKVNPVVVRRLYEQMDLMEERSRALMRGEVVVTPAELDPETGEVITPAVYNTPPSTAGALLTAVQDDFSEYFEPAAVTAVLTKMVEYSKFDGSGTWSYYAAEVVK